MNENSVVESLNSVWPVHQKSFARLLIVLRRHFDGDLDMMLILLVTSLTTIPEDWSSSLFEDTLGSADHSPTNTQSIAFATGIPRESVRRKLVSLQANGWVARTPEGYWVPTKKAALDLQPATYETLRYIRDIVSAATRRSG